MMRLCVFYHIGQRNRWMTKTTTGPEARGGAVKGPYSRVCGREIPGCVFTFTSQSMKKSKSPFGSVTLDETKEKGGEREEEVRKFS